MTNLNKILKNSKIKKFVNDGAFIDFRDYILYSIKNKRFSDGKLLFLYNELRGKLNLSPIGVLNDSEINERDISYTKNSTIVTVKDECRLGGGKICDQGDINALNFVKIKD